MGNLVNNWFLVPWYLKAFYKFLRGVKNSLINHLYTKGVSENRNTNMSKAQIFRTAQAM